MRMPTVPICRVLPRLGGGEGAASSSVDFGVTKLDGVKAVSFARAAGSAQPQRRLRCSRVPLWRPLGSKKVRGFDSAKAVRGCSGGGRPARRSWLEIGSMADWLKKFDVHVKALDGVRKRTLPGAILTLASSTLIVLLCFSELVIC